MIIVHLDGSLCRQLGQYAFGRACAQRLGVQLLVDGGTGAGQLLASFSFDAPQASRAQISAAKRHCLLREPRGYAESFWERVTDGAYLDGEWHDARYSAPVLGALVAGLNLQQLPGPDLLALLGAVRRCESVSLDLRAGQHGAAVNQAALDMLARVPQAHFYLLYDPASPPLLPTALAGRHTPVHGAAPEHALLLMAACRHHIVADRDASCWAARLDPKPAPVVIDCAPPPPPRPVPELVVYIGYGNELPVFERARALLEFYRSHYPDIAILFVRESTELGRGQLRYEGPDLVVGTGQDAAGSAGYAASGVWSASENARMIFRQVALYEHLLLTRPQPFYLFQTTVTSVVDLRALQALLPDMPEQGCFAGPTGRLNGPPEYRNLTFISGSCMLFSRDVLALARERYVAGAPEALQPNDIWLALTLRDIARLPLPSFSFTAPRDARDLHHLRQVATAQLEQGHFHFRVKGTSVEAGMGLREDVDPWVMLALMQLILARRPDTQRLRSLRQRYARFIDGGANRALRGFDDLNLYGGPRDFPLTDGETG